jgi:hypothetical protein
MGAERGRALSRALFVVWFAESLENIRQQLETGRERLLTRRLLVLADCDYPTRQPLGFIERAFRGANLHQTREYRRRLGMPRAEARLLEHQEPFEQGTRRGVVAALERDARETIQADDDVGMLGAQTALGDRQRALKERFRGVDIPSRVAHGGEPVHGLHKTRVIVAERGLADLKGAPEEAISLVVVFLAQLQLREVRETRRETQVAGAQLLRFTNSRGERLFGTGEIAPAEKAPSGLVLRFPALGDLGLHGGSLDTLKTLPMEHRHSRKRAF